MTDYNEKPGIFPSIGKALIWFFGWMALMALILIGIGWITAHSQIHNW